LPVMVFGGWLSDRIGGKPVLLFSAALLAVFAWPFFWLMHQSSQASIYTGQLGFALLTGLYLGAQPAFMVKVIPAAVRCTAAGLGYNITLGIAGGLSPMVATWLVNRTHDDLSPALMIMVASIVTVVTLWSVREPTQEKTVDYVARARDLVKAIDQGGTPSNAVIINRIARGLGLDVSKDAPIKETIERIRQALQRTS